MKRRGFLRVAGAMVAWVGVGGAAEAEPWPYGGEPPGLVVIESPPASEPDDWLGGSAMAGTMWLPGGTMWLSGGAAGDHTHTIVTGAHSFALASPGEASDHTHDVGSLAGEDDA